MEPEKYKQQKLKNSHLIIEKAKEIARESNIEITGLEWDGGTDIDISRVDFHTLKITTEGKSVQKEIYEEAIADFPYEDGGIVVETMQKMIRDLRS
jgi:hypothetical protein